MIAGTYKDKRFLSIFMVFSFKFEVEDKNEDVKNRVLKLLIFIDFFIP